MSGEQTLLPTDENKQDDRIISILNDILASYNKVHTEKISGPEISILFDSIKQEFSHCLTENGTHDIVIKWSFPKPSWAYVPWIAFLDKRFEESMTSGIYCCILFKSDMKGFYLTLIQGITQYKNTPKAERLKKLQEKNNYVRKKLNYLSSYGFHFDDGISLMAPSGSVGESYDKATILYKYFSKETLPDQADLLKDIQRVIDAYRVFSTEEDRFQSGVADVDESKSLKVNLEEQESQDDHSFIDYLQKKGFIFNNDLVVSFLLSLKVKPFVILTGPSGSGKTKLAQLFAQYQAEAHGKINDEFIVTDVKVGKSAIHEGWTFPRTEFFNYYPDLKKLQGQYNIQVDGINGKGNLELLTRLFFESNEKIKERLEELAVIDPSRRITLKIFMPTNGSSNYEIVPVGANWTENRHVVGFYNLITKEYQRTKALDLILKAQLQENEKTPFFLILDEMNLSHVERYFADFLSAIESGEKIPLHTNETETIVPANIQLSPNLSIIGTVNVDETTYMFSPKVLDRANTIEVLSEPVTDYLLGRTRESDITGSMDYLENPLVDAIELRSLTINQIHDQFQNVRTFKGPFWDQYCSELDKFQGVLKEAGLDFGFRVVNEISRFLLAAWRFEGKPAEWNNWQHYFDMQIKQKMLPKVHGSERALGKLIDDLFQLCLGHAIDKPPREFTMDELMEKAEYCMAATKLREMDGILYSRRYVSFTR